MIFMTKILIPFVDEGAKSIDLPPQSDTTSIQGNERHRRKITRRVVTKFTNKPKFTL